MRTGGGGGGGRIVVEPVELRAAAAKLQDVSHGLSVVASRLRSRPLPEMPPGIAQRVAAEIARVGGAIGDVPEPLVSTGEELRVRALWAEIADALTGGYELSGDQLTEFMALAASGALARHSTDQEMGLAGAFVGTYFRDKYRDPERLIQLATILKANGANDHFATRFVESFGAEAMADVPRVIQAMEWPGAYVSAGGSYSDPYFDSELAQQLFQDGYRLGRDPVELLGAFSLALATATTSGMLDRDTERALAHDEDAWAVAQLVHEGRFGGEFLRDLFHNGVIAKIGRDAASLVGGDLTAYAAIGGTTDHPVSTDQISLIMNALTRSPEGAVYALSAPVPPQFQVSSYLEGKSDPIEILYDVARWDDDGELFARVYATAVNHANGAGLDYAAQSLTQSLVDRTINSDNDLAPLTHALADDLAAHHIDHLHVSALANTSGDPDASGQPGRLVFEDGAWKLDLGSDEMESLFRELADEPEAYDRVLSAAAQYQAGEILAGTRVDADSEAANLLWANRIGAFDAVVLNASDLERIEDFDAGNERHRLAFSFVSTVAGLIPHPAAAAGATFGVSVLEGASSPDVQQVVEANDDAKDLIRNTLRAAIASGYYENGVLVTDEAPPHLRGEGLATTSPSALGPTELADVNRWIATHDEVYDVAGEAFDRADTELGIGDTDQQ
jgi:hypothetical protein